MPVTKEIAKNFKLKKLLEDEVKIMKEIQHPNIMHLYEYLVSGNNFYLVIQYCNGGNFEEFLEHRPNKLLPEPEALPYFKQIVAGFRVLNQEKVMHRDFKLANIFLHDNTLVIGDFGFAKSGSDMAQTKLGTPLTMAPELHLMVGFLSARQVMTAGQTCGR